MKGWRRSHHALAAPGVADGGCATLVAVDYGVLNAVEVVPETELYISQHRGVGLAVDQNSLVRRSECVPYWRGLRSIHDGEHG